MTAEEVLQSLQACHAMVWAARGRLEATWPTPDTLDSLYFAVTEIGEAIDAHLRRNPAYARNSDREMSVNAELADCAMMLLTAIPGGIDRYETRVPRGLDLAGICYYTVRAMWLYHPNLGYPVHATFPLMAIACYPGLDLRAELAERLERLERKHGRPAVQREYAANSRQYADQLAAGTIGGPVAEDGPVCSQ